MGCVREQRGSMQEQAAEVYGEVDPADQGKHCTAAMIKALPKDESKDTPPQGEKRV